MVLVLVLEVGGDVGGGGSGGIGVGGVVLAVLCWW